MSLATWKQEFYRYTAYDLKDESWEAVLDHSLLKWIGLREENLNKHGVFMDECYLRNKDLSKVSIIIIDGSSCALCEKSKDPYDDRTDCSNCPLTKVVPNNCSKEFNVFMDKYNPEPMIELLAKALDKEINK